jgi:predicted Zn finger-like uncharacterized protein
MPISVSCPSCSAGFKVKDEYAGKRAKCPKCGNPLTIPTAVQVAETMLDPPSAPAQPVAARPVVASKHKPKPVPVDDEGETPKSRKKLQPAEDEDDAPRSERRRGGDEEDTPKRRRGAGDDQPKGKRRRRDDDDEPKKKGIALPLILGIVGGVLLLCCGTPLALWFFWIKPAGESLASNVSQWPTTPNDVVPGQNPTGGGGGTPKLTRDNLYKKDGVFGLLRYGYKLEQVESLVGPGRKADVAIVQADAAKAPIREDTKKAWAQYAEKGLVYRWDNGPDRAIVAFAQPEMGSGLVGLIATFDGKTEHSFEPPPPPEVITTTAVAVAAEFSKDADSAENKYRGKILTLTGTFVEVTQNGAFVLLDGGTDGRTKTPIRVKVSMGSEDKAALGQLKRGDPVKLHCAGILIIYREEPDQSGWTLYLSSGRLAI